MDTFFQDVKYAARTLRKNPLFTVIAVVCLSVGIATNTTLFSCFNAIVLRPLPFTDPERLIHATDAQPGTNNQASISYPTFLDWRAQSRSFTGLAGAAGRSMSITEGEEPERLQGQLISANLFPTLGITPQLGRGFRDDEDKPGAAGVVLISDAVWHRRYAGDSSVINRVISINTLPYTIVGVMPPRIKFPESADLWVPIGAALGNDRREARSLVVYGRLRPNVAVEQGNRELGGISEQLNKQYDPQSQLVARATPLKSEFLDSETRTITATMFGAVTLVLLIACANVANLMLTRAAGRQREIAVRAAIGAGRGRIVRQLMTESLMLAVCAGAFAVPMTWAGLKLIDRGIPPEDPLPWYFHWGLDSTTLLYTFAIAALTSVAFGLIPALQISRGRLYDALRDSGGRSFGSARRNKMRSALVIAEIALALILLVGASLFTRTFFGLQRAKIGFSTEKLLVLRFYMPGQRYDSAAAISARAQDLVQRIEAVPNVEFATASNSIPLASCCAGSRVIIEGHRVEPGREPVINWTGISGHWFGTLGIPLVQGREFSEVEIGSKAPVAIIDQSMADRFWPKAVAIGQRFRLMNDSSISYEVIGVAPTVRFRDLDNTGVLPPIAYLPFRFLTSRNTGLMVRVRSGNPAAVSSAVRAAIRTADPSMPVFNVQTMDKVKYLSFWQYKLFSEMFGTFGAIALLLAAVGVYGVISYGVSQRTQEFGVRVALGAQGRHVFSMVLREASWLAGIGVVLGVAGAFGVTRVIASILIGVSPTDPLSFGSVAVFLTAVALLASYIPARRATRVDPLVALRAD